jgi:hypothetical protein
MTELSRQRGNAAHLVWIFELGGIVERVTVVVLAPDLALVPAIRRHRRSGRASETVRVGIGVRVGSRADVPGLARVIGLHAA